jgi:multidrug efflux pump subunit AcrA (membrane-fusion protein)
MVHCNPWIIAVTAALLPLAGCGKAGDKQAAAVPAATVEPTSESGIRRITLSDLAAKRIGIQLGEVTAVEGRLQAPYSALLYDATGAEWVYVNPEGKVYKRAGVKVDRIEGDKMYLLKGPDAGTKVVIVGAAELHGAEFEVGH